MMDNKVAESARVQLGAIETLSDNDPPPPPGAAGASTMGWR